MPISDQTQADRYYEALLARDQSFVGIFYAGVKTTSIFCIASCRARKPKRENVTFFPTFKEALDHGFRPCKICKPTENAHEAPEIVERAIRLVKSQPKEKITDYQLREQGISPEVVRRWFKQHYGMTFQAYQRMYRINNAYQELKHGKSATDTAFDTGYESLSGFGYTYKKLVGRSPSKSGSENVILLSQITTPLGPMFIGVTERGVCLLEFVDRRMLETEFSDLQRRLNATIIAGENEHTQLAKEQLASYFAGQLESFDFPLHTPGTDFQQRVWAELRNIPHGKTISYQDLAIRIGQPTAVRAVANANGHNRVAIVIPCHRVIGKDGSLTGYGGGLERKRWLLELESR